MNVSVCAVLLQLYRFRVHTHTGQIRSGPQILPRIILRDTSVANSAPIGVDFCAWILYCGKPASNRTPVKYPEIILAVYTHCAALIAGATITHRAVVLYYAKLDDKDIDFLLLYKNTPSMTPTPPSCLL